MICLAPAHAVFNEITASVDATREPADKRPLDVRPVSKMIGVLDDGSSAAFETFLTAIMLGSARN